MIRFNSRSPEFWSRYVVDEHGCWVWTGTKFTTGYGKLKINGGQQVLAHRVAYELTKGTIPKGLTIDHLCRNHLCINPDHLEPVSIAENVLRGEGVCAEKKRQTHCLRGHELSGANLAIYAGKRACRTCVNMRARRRYLKAAS